MTISLIEIFNNHAKLTEELRRISKPRLKIFSETAKKTPGRSPHIPGWESSDADTFKKHHRPVFERGEVTVRDLEVPSFGYSYAYGKDSDLLLVRL